MRNTSSLPGSIGQLNCGPIEMNINSIKAATVHPTCVDPTTQWNSLTYTLLFFFIAPYSCHLLVIIAGCLSSKPHTVNVLSAGAPVSPMFKSGGQYYIRRMYTKDGNFFSGSE
jgi:hypothetical protein